jgi:hypothetical protein
MAREEGFSVVELLVATAIALAVVSSTLALVNRLRAGYAGDGERTEMQQRLRVASDRLLGRLLVAGAGPSQGSAAGPLVFFVPGVLPFRQGAKNSDPPGTFKTDTITLIHVPSGSAASTIRQPMLAQSGLASIELEPGCPFGDLDCGFAVGADVMVFDETGSYDTFRVLDAQNGVLQLRHTMVDTPHLYPPGAAIVDVAIDGYYPKADAATDTYQLMHYDGVDSTAPVVDHVVELGFEYYGDPSPPRLVKSVSDPVGPWTTYGPRPPQLDVQRTLYPAGENCVFQVDADGVSQIARLPALASGTALVKLAAAQLADGPWCPDASDPRRFDADLLRIRKVSVRLRVEAAQPMLRGPAGVLFRRAGTSRTADRWVPDLQSRFDVVPRNLNLGR